MTTVGGTGQTYDANGNQTGRGSDTFSYDHENRLTQAVIGGSSDASLYSGDGLRMSYTYLGSPRNFVWDISSSLPLTLEDGVNTYVYGLDLISSTDSSGTQTYLHYDGLGSTVNLTDGTGTVFFSYWYDVFGAIRHQSGSGPSNHWKFAGEWRDWGSGLDHLRARHYDPSSGRFLSQDPARADHPYAYVGNNPVAFIDPYGLDLCDAAGSFLGAEEECRWVGDKAEAGANAVVESSKKVYEEVKESPIADIAKFASRFVTPECGIFAAGLAGLAIGGWQGIVVAGASAGGDSNCVWRPRWITV
jgi:RHS repeat-associated protein